MVRKERVSVDMVKFALAWMWEAKVEAIIVLSCIQAEQIVQPSLDWVINAVPDWLLKLSLH